MAPSCSVAPTIPENWVIPLPAAIVKARSVEPSASIVPPNLIPSLEVVKTTAVLNTELPRYCCPKEFTWAPVVTSEPKFEAPVIFKAPTVAPDWVIAAPRSSVVAIATVFNWTEASILSSPTSVSEPISPLIVDVPANVTLPGPSILTLASIVEPVPVILKSPLAAPVPPRVTILRRPSPAATERSPPTSKSPAATPLAAARLIVKSLVSLSLAILPLTTKPSPSSAAVITKVLSPALVTVVIDTIFISAPAALKPTPVIV